MAGTRCQFLEQQQLEELQNHSKKAGDLFVMKEDWEQQASKLKTE